MVKELMGKIMGANKYDSKLWYEINARRVEKRYPGLEIIDLD